MDKPLLPFGHHDHSQCVMEALRQAEARLKEEGQRMTSLRRQVLDIIWASHKPVGAYDILEALTTRQAKKPAPPTVYRVLAFLLEYRLVHRIDSLNAYIGCAQHEGDHCAQFYICSECGAAAEVIDSEVIKLLQKQAKSIGFRMVTHGIEVTGVCYSCGETD